MGYSNLLGIPRRGLGPTGIAQSEPVWVSAPFQTASGTPTSNGPLKLLTFSESHAVYNPNTGVFSVIKDGPVTLSAGVEVSGVFTSGQYVSVSFVQSGSKSDSAYNHISVETNITKQIIPQLTHTFSCRVGDVITITVGSNGSSLSFSSSLSGSHLSIIG